MLNLDATATLRELVAIVRRRWPIEQQYRELKDELGIDHFEGRSYRGWTHHTVLTAIAFTFLQLERMRPDEEPRPTLPHVRLWVREIMAVLYVVSNRKLRRGCSFSGRSPWSKAFWTWLDTVSLAEPAQRLVLEEYRQTVTEAGGRVDRLTQELANAVEHSPLAAPVHALQTLRGVSLIVAATMVAEIGRLQRFDHPKQLMAYVGLVPSEDSSGPTRHRGPITKTGNSHVRRMLVEASWAYRHAARMSATLRRRQAGQADTVTAIAWRAQLRLCGPFRRLVGRARIRCCRSLNTHDALMKVTPVRTQLDTMCPYQSLERPESLRMSQVSSVRSRRPPREAGQSRQPI